MINSYHFMILLNRVKIFGDTLNAYNKDIESFRKKEIANTEEMQRNVDKLSDLGRLLDEATTELEVISKFDLASI